MVSGNVPAMLLMSICALAFSTIVSAENVCDEVTCLNGGTCLDEQSNYTCQCPDGINGTHCETVDSAEKPRIYQFNNLVLPCGSMGYSISCSIGSSTSGRTTNLQTNVTFIRLDDGVDLRTLPQEYSISLYPYRSTRITSYLTILTGLRTNQMFQCRASTHLGTAVATANLTIGPPATISPRRNENVTINATASDVELMCSFHSFQFYHIPLLEFSVYRHGEQVTNGSNRLTYYYETRSPYRLTFSIRISTPTVEDAGIYTCQVTATCNYTVESTVSLRVVDTACDGVICSNGGTCLGEQSSYTCQCPDGFSGTHCDMDSSECPPGSRIFRHQNGATYCYSLHGKSTTQRLNWVDALAACRSLGSNSDLVSIQDQSEHNFVVNVIQQADFSTDRIWIGYNDRAIENTFVWSDGTPSSFTNWNSGEPNDLFNEDCAVIFNNAGSWNDAYCSVSSAYICKLVAASTPSTRLPQETVQIVTGAPGAEHGVRLQCSSSRMKVTIPFSTSNPDLFSTPCMFGEPAGGVSTDEYVRQHWGNQAAIVASSVGPLNGHCHCAATRDDLNSRWVFDYALHQCNTSAPVHMATPAGYKLVYLNNVFSGKRLSQELVSSSNYNATVRITSYPPNQHFINFQAKCSFDDVIFTSSYGYVITRITFATFNISGVGVFSVTSGFVSSATRPSDPPTPDTDEGRQFTIGSPVTFEVSLETTSALVIHPVECWLSTGNIDHIPKFDIVRHGCPDIAGVNVSSTQWKSGQNGRFIRLSYDAFVFRGQEDATYYLHCSMRICTAQTAASVCRASCDELVVFRRRRQESDVVQISDGNALFTFTSPGYQVNATVPAVVTPPSISSTNSRSGVALPSLALETVFLAMTMLFFGM